MVQAAWQGPTESPARPRTWAEIVTLQACLKAALVVGLMAWVFRSELDRLTWWWSTKGDWSHGWLVPLGSLYFLYLCEPKLARVSLRGSYLGLPVLLGALGLYVASIWPLQIAVTRSLAIVLAIFGVVILLAGVQAARAVWFPIALLLLAVPWPEQIYVAVTMPFRKLAASVAGPMLSLIPGVQAEVAGTVINYTYHGRPGTPLDVERACSGMRMMMAFCTLGVAMAFLWERPLWHRVVMILCCVPIAVFCNFVRVTATGLFHVFSLDNLARGTPHALLAVAMLPIAFGLFGLVSYILNHLFVEEPDEPPAEPAAGSVTGGPGR